MESPEIEARLITLEQKVSGLSNNTNLYPVIPDARSKGAVKDTISDTIIDIVWNKYFYYYSLFEEIIDGWSLSDSSSGVSVTNAAGVLLATGNVSGNKTSINKNPIYTRVITFDQPSRFRTSFSPTQVTSTTVVLSVGDGTSGTVTPHYGFRLENATLYAITANGISETKVAIKTLVAADVIVAEARHFPGQKVVFYCSDNGSGQLIERATISTTLPSGSIFAALAWLEFKITTSTTAQRSVGIDFVEYIQRRDPQSY